MADNDPTTVTPLSPEHRHICAAQFEKANLVSKLRAARDRKSAAMGGRRIEGRRGYDDINPPLVREAKRLARRSPKTGRTRSLRQIASEFSNFAGEPTPRLSAVFPHDLVEDVIRPYRAGLDAHEGEAVRRPGILRAVR